jgi:hypothetical protein
MVEFMAKGNAVKVTKEDHKLKNRVGVIISSGTGPGDFRKVDFGTHQSTENINALFDMTYDLLSD